MRRLLPRKGTPTFYALKRVKACMPHPLLSLSLTVLWLLLVNSFSAGALVLGALLGWLIPFATSRFWPEAITVRQPGVLLRFLGVFAWDIVRGSFQVAGLILRGPARLRPASVHSSKRIKNPF